MQVRPGELVGRKQIGALNGAPVFELLTSGGYYIVAAVKKDKIDQLGVGPRRAVARFLARKSNPELVINALAKSEQLDIADFEPVLPYWEDFTAQLRAQAS
jgi:hypothetical protein